MHVSDIFAEIDEDLRAERASRLLRKYGGLLVGLAVAVVLAVGGWQLWRAHMARETARVAQEFMNAERDAAVPAQRDTAFALLEKVAKEGAPGYRTLARLRAAALRFDAGDTEAALGLWNAVAADQGADPLLRDFAVLQWCWHQIDSGDPKLLAGRLAPLAQPGNAWQPLAEEAQALVDLRAGNTDAARATLKRLSQDPQVPDGVRGRAGGLLARLGG
jgi:hypothetical protein